MDSTDAAGASSRVLFGRYRIERPLGRGGMGEVLLARDELLQRRVALKRVIPQGDDRATVRRNVLREARRASRIGDRHVMQIYDVVELPDEVMLVMEYVEGVTLRERLKQPLTPAEFRRLAPQCVAGVAAAHAQGVIHRDIKPENFMVTPAGEVKVLDFGIARRTDPGVDVTTTGSTRSDSSWGHIAGTPAYMAPEVLMGEGVDERTDLFALGVVFYEMLTGRRPFEGAQFAAVANQILNAAPPTARELNAEVSPSLSNLVSAMLAKKPDERVASAAELEGLLAEALNDPESKALREAGERGARSAITLPGRGRPATQGRSFFHTPAGVAVLAVALAPAALLLWRAFTVPRLPAEINVAVLPPETPGATEDFASFALGAMEHVHARLRRHTFDDDFQLASFNDAVTKKVRTAPEARQQLGTNLALSTRLEQTPDRLLARLDLLDTSTGRVAVSRRVSVPVEQPFQYLDRIGRESAAMLQRSADADSGRERLGVRGAGTLRFYLQGMGRVRSAETVEQLLSGVEDLQSACRAEPGAAVAWAGLAAAQLRLRQKTGDSTWLARADSSSWMALTLDSTRVQPLRIRAFVFSVQKRFPAAIREYERAVASDSTDIDLSLLYARSLASGGDREAERGIYRAEAARRPRAWQPWWWLAAWSQRDGDIDEAVRCYREMVRRAPLFHQGYTDLGGDLVLKGRYAQAIDTLRTSIRLMPTQEAFDNLGAAYFNLGRLPEASDAFNQSLQFGQADYRTWLNLGDAYYWQPGHTAQALDAYRQAIRVARERADERARRSATTQDVVLLSNFAVLFARVGMPDSARAYVRRAVLADSASSEVQYRVALAYWALKEREPALTALEKSIRSGYPVPWIRDSPMFRDWRDQDRFRRIVGDTLTKQGMVASTASGG